MDTNKTKIIEENQRAWNKVAEKFVGAEALPFWHPLDDGSLKDLIGEIKDVSFLEIACGSGHSIKYLLDKGAKSAIGIDFSKQQITFAKKLNKKYLDRGKAKFLCQPMEKTFGINTMDTVFSIYGFGWTQEPKKVLTEVFNTLKPGGRFIWSWDHPLCSISQTNGNEVKIIDPYHRSKLVKRKLFDESVHQLVSSISWWMKTIKEIGFTIEKFLEVEPNKIPEDFNDYDGYYNRAKILKLPPTMIWILKK